MHHPARPQLLRRPVACAIVGAAAALTLALISPGCQTSKPNTNAAVKVTYPTLAPKSDVPEFMKGTIWELTERTNDEPYATASYGLVGRLRGTGDSTVSLPVRQWMIKQMTRHGYGSRLLEEYKHIGAETILNDPHYSIVRVDGLLPPGAREGDFFDVTVSALPGNKTSSLSGGLLFESDLYRIRGSSPDLEGVEIFAKSRGPIVVNPAYALNDPTAAEPGGQAKASLRSGLIIGGGRAMRDRPILLRLRNPTRPMARAIENRINQRFQKYADKARRNIVPVNFQVAAALDEGIVEVYVPKSYPGDWRHFMGVCEALYVSSSPALTVTKAKQLAEEAVRPDAPLQEISFALEGIGEPALQYTLPLMAHGSPDVAFAMARASAFIGDNSGAAQAVLLRIAADNQNPFQLAAIETLGALPDSPERNQKLRPLLDSQNTLARAAAFKVLARNRDSSVTTWWIKDPRDGRPDDERHEKFALDIVPARGEPLVHATRSGIPRISLIGPTPRLRLPIVFTTMGGRLMISSPNVGQTVTIFYRDDARKEPLKMTSRPDLAQVIARLGGEGAATEDKFDFTYGEIVAVVQELSRQKLITADRGDGRLTLAPFILEQPGDTQDMIESAPVIEDTRPNTSGAVRKDDDDTARERNAAG